MSATIRYFENSILVNIDGELDHHSASLIRAGIDEAVIRCRPQKLTLDFSGVGFMDSSGVGLVMGRYKLMKAVSGEVEITGLSPLALKMMRLAGIERIVSIKENVSV
ncbi:MAG: anti-sigma factor antagonist [Clostridia bacterium]|nr:anti-sigma factor antagonist [Clostridia bacterium]